MVDELPQAQHRRVRRERLRRRTVAHAADAQRAAERDAVLLVHVQHPPPQRRADGAFAQRWHRVQVPRVAMEADRVRQSNGGAEERPRVEKAARVGEIRTHHDQRLDAQKRRAGHERGEPKRLHAGRHCSPTSAIVSRMYESADRPTEGVARSSRAANLFACPAAAAALKQAHLEPAGERGKQQRQHVGE